MLKWTYEACYEEAKKYKSRGEFSDKSPSAWYRAKKNGWIEDYTWFEEKVKPNGYWTYEHCYEEALKYKTRTEFEDNCNSAVSVARKNGWMDDYTWMPIPTNINVWNYENTYNEAQKYKNKSEFKFGNNSAYNSARKHGWLKDYVWLKDERFDLFKDKIDMIYSYEFTEQKTVYVGRTLMRTKKQRDYQHIFGDDSVSKFAKENNISVPEMKILEDNLTIKEGSENEGVWLELYKEDGWNILNKAKTGSIGGLGKGHSAWNYESCYKEAEKYKTKTDFFNNSNRAYEVARKNNWLGDYTWFKSGFEKLSEERKLWTFEKCSEESKKYSSLKDFREFSHAAYTAAYKYGYLDKFDWLKHERTKRGTYQSYNNCKQEASKYKSKSEFRKNNSSAYSASLKHGWLDEFFPKNK